MEAIEFIIARYNYWIVIILMMTGLYTVIARGNLVKKIIGLNLFQTSVFIFYITIGKVAGGTAPIYVPGDMEARTDHHGDDHGKGGEDGGYGKAAEDGHGADHADAAPESLHGDLPANDLDAALEATPPVGDTSDGAIHAAPSDAANDLLLTDEGVAPKLEIEPAGDHAAAAVSDAAHAAIDVVYSNPLPHVLILTAIVVGVATTAVGLALAVRVREAYGTIEEDELEAADNLAEFGEADAAEASA